MRADPITGFEIIDSGADCFDNSGSIGSGSDTWCEEWKLRIALVRLVYMHVD